MSELFVFISAFDDGTNDVDFSFRASSREEVAEFILAQMNEKTLLGRNFLQTLFHMGVKSSVFSADPDLTDSENHRRRNDFIKSRSPVELLALIDDSYVDGDSWMKISLSKISEHNIIHVNKKQDDVILLDQVEPIVKLINFVFKNLELSHLTWNGKTWYPHTCKNWYDERSCPDDYNPEHDPDYPCYGYWGHCFDPNVEDPDGDRDEEVEIPYTPHMVQNFKDIKHVFSTSGRSLLNLETKIKLNTDMLIQNSFGCLNTDHRGSNHFGIEFDHLFEGFVEIKAGTYTIAEFANLAWQIKGNKCDDQYELMCTTNDKDVEFQDGQWYVQVPVDHGS